MNIYISSGKIRDREKKKVGKNTKTMCERRFVGPIVIAIIFPHLRRPTTHVLESTCIYLVSFLLTE